MNFETLYLAALEALIVGLGGVVPTAPALNFRDAEIADLRAIVLAVGGIIPPPQLNYQDRVLANWRAAIVARSGVVPTQFQNFRQAHLLHVQAFQAALGQTVAITGSYQDALLNLLIFRGGGGFRTDVQAWITAVEASGANFGPSPGAIATNKTAVNTLIQALATAGALAPLTVAGESHLHIMAGVSTYDVPAFFGDLPVFTGFSLADFEPLQGLRGGTGRMYTINRNANQTPLDDHGCAVYLPSINSGVTDSTLARMFGPPTAAGVLLTVASQSRTKTSSNVAGGTLNGVAGLHGVSRTNSANFDRSIGGVVTNHVIASASQPSQAMAFMADNANTNNSGRTFAASFYGRGFNLASVHSAMQAYIASLVWV